MSFVSTAKTSFFSKCIFKIKQPLQTPDPVSLLKTDQFKLWTTDCFLYGSTELSTPTEQQPCNHCLKYFLHSCCYSNVMLVSLTSSHLVFSLCLLTSVLISDYLIIWIMCHLSSRINSVSLIVQQVLLGSIKMIFFNLRMACAWQQTVGAVCELLLALTCYYYF